MNKKKLEVETSSGSAATSRIDVVYTQVPTEPWEAMPVGGGDLTAMARIAGKIDLHLGKCDAWGMPAQMDVATPQLLSPGHIAIYLSPDPIATGELLSFEQRLLPLQGRVEAIMRTNTGDICVRIWGDMEQHALNVEIEDNRSDRGDVEVQLCDWRGTTIGHCTDGSMSSREEINALIGNFSSSKQPEEEPFIGRVIEVAVGATGAGLAEASRGSGVIRLTVPRRSTRRCRVVIACEVSAQSEQFVKATDTLHRVLSEPLVRAKRRHAKWWKEFWSRSSMLLEGDEQAEFLTQQWHLFYYQKAISSRGRYAAQFNGGVGLFEGDRRSWGLGSVWQNDREHLWPLGAGNHPELADNAWRFFSDIIETQRRFTRELWGIGGIHLTERVSPWYDQLNKYPQQAQERERGCAGGLRHDRPAFYFTHLFSSGAELVVEMLNHVRHTGDERFLKEIAYPWLVGVCEFYANFARLGDDGLYHFAPANANETWWKVKDTINDLCAVHICFSEFVALSRRFRRDQKLARRCRKILGQLPELPTGQWKAVGQGEKSRIVIDQKADKYAPAHDPFEETQIRNHENPECYVIFPWSVTGIDAPDHERAVRTFKSRRFPIADGWAQCGVQAARLGLRDEAAALLREHARRFQLLPFGGWHSTTDMVFRKPDGTLLPDCSYLDAAGAHLTALQEMLLQSYPQHHATDWMKVQAYGTNEGGVIRICPCVPVAWSGRFKLHAMGGFLVECEFRRGKPVRIEITSERGSLCRLAAPWPETVVRCEGKMKKVESDAQVEFNTQAGKKYILHAARKFRTMQP